MSSTAAGTVEEILQPGDFPPHRHGPQLHELRTDPAALVLKDKAGDLLIECGENKILPGEDKRDEPGIGERAVEDKVDQGALGGVFQAGFFTSDFFPLQVMGHQLAGWFQEFLDPRGTPEQADAAFPPGLLFGDKQQGETRGIRENKHPRVLSFSRGSDRHLQRRLAVSSQISGFFPD
ncbi:hypothetical protein [Corynebacterium glutamicum]|uniref:hypothetical protein n=1 Tax=Corynebacterium glutamicum TaxID=1718 RepID=UPI001E616F75|nr:hypothetical protein [Corynebacterium glutamicum]